MAVAQTLVLGDEPIPDSEGAVQLDFYSQESHLGAGERPRLLKEGTLTLGRADLYQVMTSATSEALRPVPLRGMPPIDRYLVVLPFTLHPALGDRKYQKVVFKVELDNPNIIASELMPKDIFTEEDIKKTHSFGGTIEYQGVGGKVELSQEVSFTRLRPVITAFGEGESRFAWTFTSQPNQEINSGSKRVAAILKVPHDTDRVSGRITYQLDVQRKWLGDWKTFEAETEPYSISLLFDVK